jgi:acetyl-CoA carboxylase alpha subunit
MSFMHINTLKKHFSSLFSSNKDQDPSLQEQVDELKKKLIEKQKQIDKTNAYWKKKFYALKTKKPNN